MVKRYGAHLAVAFAPISERAIFPNDGYISQSENSIASFSRDNPDVTFLFPLITQWSPEKFSSPNHVSREYTFLSSMRLGRAVGRLMTNPESFPTYASRHVGKPLSPIEHEITGPADLQLLRAAFAFYLYTQTLDENYEKLISRRVLELLKHDNAYQYMIEDARARNSLFAKKKVEIGFDLSQMRARPISISGISYCDEQPDTKWVQVDGTLNFTYRSAEAIPAPEPVKWPENSNIDIPLIREDGILKFDGYCPEMDSAIANLGDPVPVQ
jgi:hypothetical protein